MGLPEQAKERWASSASLRIGPCAVVLAERERTLALCREVLEGSALALYAVQTAEEAIRAARAPFAKLFLIDLLVPGATEAVRVASRVRDGLPPAPVVALNAGTVLEARLAEEAGAALTFNPTVTPVTLKQAAWVLLEGRRS